MISKMNCPNCGKPLEETRIHKGDWWDVVLCTNEDCEFETWHEYTGEYIAKLEAENAALKEELAKRQWVSVEDKLPEPDIEDGEETTCLKDVLIYGNKRFRGIAFYNHGYTRWELALEHDIWFTITHWMPLPEPPEQEEKPDA